MPRVDRLRSVGTYEGKDEAAAALKSHGDMAVVFRGVARMLLIRCPCGCGDDLVVNLDRRAGPAWRMYARNDGVSLFPSYWRETACGSHFIVWSNQIHWCTWDHDEDFWTNSSRIQDRVFEALPTHFAPYQDVADAIGEIPWEVLQACHHLTFKGLAEANTGRRRGEFRRIASSSDQTR